jgi:DNA-binding HxlR family transcriptional regulator
VVQSRLPLHACSYTEEVFRLLGKRWTGLLIDLLLQRPARFSELAAALPQLSKRVLSERLAELQDIGLVLREVDDGRPVSVSYRLTERGQGLGPAMGALRVWAGAPVDEHGQPLPFSAVTHSDETR